jgi:gas vesicle protein
MGQDDYRRDSGDNISTRLTYLLIGGGIGAILALLFAPKSGHELRGDIADATRKGIDRSREAAQQLGDRASITKLRVVARLSFIPRRLKESVRWPKMHATQLHARLAQWPPRLTLVKRLTRKRNGKPKCRAGSKPLRTTVVRRPTS